MGIAPPTCETLCAKCLRFIDEVGEGESIECKDCGKTYLVYWQELGFGEQLKAVDVNQDSFVKLSDILPKKDKE